MTQQRIWTLHGWDVTKRNVTIGFIFSAWDWNSQMREMISSSGAQYMEKDNTR